MLYGSSIQKLTAFFGEFTDSFTPWLMAIQFGEAEVPDWMTVECGLVPNNYWVVAVLRVR
jgi:hypothetical protein